MQIDIDKNSYSVVGSKRTALTINTVLRKTYLLLSLTLLWSGFTAYYAMQSGAKPLGAFATIIGMFGLLFLTQALRNSRLGLVAVFAFTGFMGYVLGPTLHLFLHTYTNGGAIITASLAGTGTIFLSLSGFALITRKDFSFLGGILFVGIGIAFIASLAGLFLHMPILQVAISSLFMLICSGLILFHTDQIIHGGETNYISATISLYVALLNIFVSLLNILGFFAGEKR